MCRVEARPLQTGLGLILVLRLTGGGALARIFLTIHSLIVLIYKMRGSISHYSAAGRNG